MGARERVRDAIQSSVDAAEEELRELQDANAETRLTVLIDGWARGLGAALEELAIAVDELDTRRPAAGTPAEQQAPPVVEEAEVDEVRPEKTDLRGASEERLVDEARRSRDATAELQEEGEEARRDLDR